jgi:hypothetical protein
MQMTCRVRVNHSSNFPANRFILKHTDQNYLQRVVLPKFHDACMNCLHEERFFGTTNHYFDSKFLEDEICPPQLMELFKAKANALLQDDEMSPPCNNHKNYRIVSVDHLDACLREAKQETANQAAHTDLMANQKRRLFAAITAHFDVEKKTFVDNLLKKTKDILIHGHRDWIERELLRSKKISESATEDEHVKKLRRDLLERVERLKECMTLLRDVPLPANEESGKKRKAGEISS